MSSEAAPAALPDGWQPVCALPAADGSVRQPGFLALADRRAARRDLADAVHCLCLLHGHHPGPIDLARDRADHPVARDWLTAAAAGFAGERDWLARLVAAVGPLPSTPNQTGSETAIATQRHALEMLARSERNGCALGAAAALVVDWRAMRPGLESIGERVGVAAAACTLPATPGALAAVPLGRAQARAVAFGADQLVAQHRGLWALIEARASARGDA